MAPPAPPPPLQPLDGPFPIVCSNDLMSRQRRREPEQEVAGEEEGALDEAEDGSVEQQMSSGDSTLDVRSQSSDVSMVVIVAEKSAGQVPKQPDDQAAAAAVDRHGGQEVVRIGDGQKQQHGLSRENSGSSGNVSSGGS